MKSFEKLRGKKAICLRIAVLHNKNLNQSLISKVNFFFTKMPFSVNIEAKHDPQNQKQMFYICVR